MTRFWTPLKTLMLVGMTCAVSNLAVADIFLDRAIVRMTSKQSPREDVKVINNGDEVGYVQVEVFEVRNPGTEQEERVKVTDPDALKLIVSPSKLMIHANSQKLIRIVNLDPNSADERIYRVNVTPVLPPLQDDQSSVVRVVVAYQILVIVDPAEPQENISIERSGFRLTVKNDGNTNVLLSDGKQCDADGAECVDIAAHRVYPGNSWQTDLEKDQPATFKVTSFNGIREIQTK